MGSKSEVTPAATGLLLNFKTHHFRLKFFEKVVDTKTDDVIGGDFELSFADQGLKVNTADDAKEIVDQINATKIITTLTFSGNTVGIEAAEAIGNSLKSHPELKYAHWKDMFTGKMKTEIPPALIHLSHGLMTANARLVKVLIFSISCKYILMTIS